MPMALRSACVGLDDMALVSHIVIQDAIANNHSLGDAIDIPFCDTWGMDSQEKNGGENHLKAWREYRKITQQGLATMVGTTQHQIAYLENGDRALSAKWLRRLAPWLNTTPGMLLDHNPNDLDNDIVEIFASANPREKRQITETARAIVKTGTDD